MMKITWKSLFLITMAFALAACQPQADEAPAAGEETAAAAETEAPAEEPQMGPDPVEVDADHYTVELENDQVRVVRITYGAGEESVMHYHPDAVAVYLTAQDVSFELPDGTTEEVVAEAGDVITMPAGQHLPRNLGEEPLELILLELKGDGSAAEEAGEGEADEGEAAEAETGPDPVEVDADHYAVVLENDQVRVVRITYGAGEESVMHYHPDAVAVSLTAQNASFEFPDGTTEEVVPEAGDVITIPAGQHLPRNLGEEPFEVILVELKDGS